MKRIDRTGWALLAVAVVLISVLVWTAGCAVKRWEQRINRVEDAVDGTETVVDKAKVVQDKVAK